MSNVRKRASAPHHRAVFCQRGEPKVAQLHFATRVYKQVFRLNIQVANASAVNVHHCRHELGKVRPNVLPRLQPSRWRNHFKHFAAFANLKHQEPSLRHRWEAVQQRLQWMDGAKRKRKKQKVNIIVKSTKAHCCDGTTSAQCSSDTKQEKTLHT